MGFTIDMMTGDIQDISTGKKEEKSGKDELRYQQTHLDVVVPQIQEYNWITTATVHNEMPENLYQQDVDVFLDEMLDK